MKYRLIILFNLVILLFLSRVTRAQSVIRAENSREIKVQKIKVEGSTLFTSEIKEMTEVLEKKEFNLEELFLLKDKITEYYTSRGYINSGAFIPPQEINNEEIKIIVLEGTLRDIVVSGLKNISKNYLLARLPKVNTVLNKNKIEDSLSLLKQDPLIREIEAEIAPGGVGKSILLVDVVEKSPLTAALTLTNAYSESIGSLGGNLEIAHNNLLGWGDRLSLKRSQTKGLGLTGIAYTLPFNNSGGSIALSYTNVHSEVITESLENLGIEADFESFLLKISQALIYRPDERLMIVLSLERINSESFVLEDFSFAFTAGLPDGKSDLSVLRLSQEYTKKWNNALFLINSSFNVGLDIFDATRTERGIDGIFSSWQGEVQYLQALDSNGDVVLATRLSTQLSADELLPIERFTLGGTGSVLGYARNIGNGDNGVFGSLELQLEIADGSAGNLALIPFFNVGGIWNNERETNGANFLASVGLGLSYSLNSAVKANFNYGIPLVIPDGFEANEATDNFGFSIKFYPL